MYEQHNSLCMVKYVEWNGGFDYSGKGFMIRRKVAQYLSRRKWVIKVLENPVNLGEFRQRPTPRLISGLILMGLSFILGWPSVAALGFLAAYLKEPLIAFIGCPAVYVFSHIVFIVGAWVSRAPHYFGILARYSLQSILMKILPGE